MSGPKRVFSVVGGGAKQSFLRIAFATDNGHSVNQHFGSARSFAIYQVNPEHAQLQTVAEFELPEGADSEDKLAAKLALLEGCIAVYCSACGASAVRQLLEQDIQPLKVTDDSPIKALIRAFQRELAAGPSAWLAQAIKRQRGDMHDFIRDQLSD